MLTARFCLIAKNGWLFALEFSSSQLKREMQLVTRFINSLSYKQDHCSGDECNIPDTEIPGDNIMTCFLNNFHRVNETTDITEEFFHNFP